MYAVIQERIMIINGYIDRLLILWCLHKKEFSHSIQGVLLNEHYEENITNR